MLGDGAANDIDGDGDVDPKADVLGAEDLAFGRGEVALDLVVGKIVELDGGKFIAEAFDDAGDGIVDGWVFADVSGGGDRQKRQSKK